MAERGGSGTRDDERRVPTPAGPPVARGAFSVRDVRDVRADVRALRLLALGAVRMPRPDAPPGGSGGGRMPPAGVVPGGHRPRSRTTSPAPHGPDGTIAPVRSGRHR
ncbi:hypothetical protein Ae406Ps2_0193 [Pseudonocardia sp. Ae406_Ps2]|nr:hypothetical protein Ae406Ps2_0193 [Pseudonocardia sp. Ae406_Ps2]OLM08014.1 hypothetical protein Ae331Ps2_5724c [Pseudonocardia sp. Ae331_Ps2]OLM13753.1 hypothetical protein Ae505Ps2_3882 [Pseudonocardia sp. Ae505_Ps2]OLM21762.1 hypothetical protein Ae706Ps2_0194 [Pseudonocardia sp. Ae706_Ps2]